MNRLPFTPAGVIPACLLPFHSDFSIDEQSLRAHLRDLADTPGVTAIVVNAHASEVASCTFEEQRRVFEVAMDAVGDRVPLVHGVYAEGSIEAARIARMADAAGASALLVFPPNPFALGHTPAMVIEHFRRIADASPLPLIAFEYPLATPQGYKLDTMLELFAAVPSICAIKDWSGDAQAHEAHIRALQAEQPNIAVLGAHSAWLLSSLVLGCRGIISGAGSVIAGMQGEMLRAVMADDLTAAREVSDRMFPLASVFYTDPWVDMHNRMKEALVISGKLPCAAVRPPLLKLGEAEIGRIRAAMQAAGMLNAAAV